MPIPDLGEELRPTVSGVAREPVVVEPPLEQVNQDEDLWCWAACVESGLQGRVSQLDVAVEALGKPANRSRSAEQIESLWRRYGFSRATLREGPLTPAGIHERLVESAFQVLLGGPTEKEPSRGGHVVLVDGIQVGSHGWVEYRVMDPDRKVYREKDRWVGDLSGFRDSGPWRRTIVDLKLDEEGDGGC